MDSSPAMALNSLRLSANHRVGLDFALRRAVKNLGAKLLFSAPFEVIGPVDIFLLVSTTNQTEETIQLFFCIVLNILVCI